MAGRRGARGAQQTDRVLAAQCSGEVYRRAEEGESIAAIIAVVREMAGERLHVLVEDAAILAGVWAVRPSLPATNLIVAGILLEAAGANDLDQLGHYVKLSRERGRARPYTAS